MDDTSFITEQFEQQRPRLRKVAYRMLGSVPEADDAVQEAWLRLNRSDADAIDNLAGWLTTVVSRVCLDALRSRATRREDPLDLVHVPDPLLSASDAVDPEHEALLGDAVGLALLVVLEQLPPAERLAFVLHDMFAMPFEDIAPIVDRTPTATRQLASRARRRVQGDAPPPDPDLAKQREVVDAFFAAARLGDFDALVAVLDPDVVLRSDAGAAHGRGRAQTRILRGAEAVASQALTFRSGAPWVRPALVNGAAGVVVLPPGRAVSVIGFTVRDGRIVAIDALADPARLAQLDLTFLDD